jgi:hypothetical protein
MYNLSGDPVMVHWGRCRFLHEKSALALDGTEATELQILFEDQKCCACGRGQGLFRRHHVHSTTLSSEEYNPGGNLVYVHNGSCNDLFMAACREWSKDRENTVRKREMDMAGVGNFRPSAESRHVFERWIAGRDLTGVGKSAAG